MPQTWTAGTLHPVLDHVHAPQQESDLPARSITSEWRSSAALLLPAATQRATRPDISGHMGKQSKLIRTGSAEQPAGAPAKTPPSGGFRGPVVLDRGLAG